MIQASIRPQRSIAGNTSWPTLASIAASDHGKEGLNKALRGWGSIEIAAAKDSAGLSLSALV